MNRLDKMRECLELLRDSSEYDEVYDNPKDKIWKDERFAKATEALAILDSIEVPSEVVVKKEAGKFVIAAKGKPWADDIKAFRAGANWMRTRLLGEGEE